MAYRFAGRTAVVTGAASGMGASLARQLADLGCNLALADRDEKGLQAVAGKLSGVKVTTHPLDVSDRAAVAALPDAVMDAHGQVDILINNAGIAAMGRFDQTSLETFDKVMAINFGGTIAMTKAFLPYLSRDGRIANLSSLFGLIAPPGQVPYVASKFAVRGFSEALRLELAGTGIKVTSVHPGGIRTAIAKNAVVADGISDASAKAGKDAFGKFLRMSADKAASKIIAAVAAGKPRLLIGSDAKFGDMLARSMPATYGRVLLASMGGMKKHVGQMEVGAGRPVQKVSA